MQIKLTRGLVCEIDDADFAIIRGYTWHCSGRGSYLYASTVVRDNGKKGLLGMHRLLTDCPKGLVVDHKDGNTLNNKRSNLRICTQQDNIRNRKLNKDSTSGVKGVTRSSGKWRAQIYIDGKTVHLGCFSDIHMAIAARLEGERKYYGEFARPCVLLCNIEKRA